MKKIGKVLSNSSVFKDIEEHEIERMIESVGHSVERFSKGEIVHVRGEKVNEVSVLISGKVRTEMVNYDGNALQVSQMGESEVLALGFLFAKDNRYPVDVVAEENVTFLVLPKESILKLCSSSRIVLVNVLECVGEKMHSLSSKIEVLSMKNIRQKLAYYLLQFDSEADSAIVLSMNREKLANVFGVARPSLSRVLSELEKECVINFNRERVKILDRKKLCSIAFGKS